MCMVAFIVGHGGGGDQVSWIVRSQTLYIAAVSMVYLVLGLWWAARQLQASFSNIYCLGNTFIASVPVDILKCGAWWWMCIASTFSSFPLYPFAKN